jgi:hypothetical protein
MNQKAKALLGAIFLGALASAQAQLTWEKTEIELNPKAGDQEAVANFRYQNKTDKPIRIKSTRSSCGCTVASLQKDVVEPGEKGEVTATFKIGGRTGPQQKVVTVETDDAAQPVTNLILKANIAQAIEVQPPLVMWQQGEAASAKIITVKAAKDVPITKLDVQSSTPDFSADVEKGSAPGEFKIKVQPKDTSKLLNGMLTIKPDYPQAFYATMKVTNAPAPH